MVASIPLPAASPGDRAGLGIPHQLPVGDVGPEAGDRAARVIVGWPVFYANTAVHRQETEFLVVPIHLAFDTDGLAIIGRPMPD